MGSLSEEGDSGGHVSHNMMLQNVDNLLAYVGQRGFEYSDVAAARKIHTAVRRSLSNS